MMRRSRGTASSVKDSTRSDRSQRQARTSSVRRKSRDNRVDDDDKQPSLNVLEEENVDQLDSTTALTASDSKFFAPDPSLKDLATSRRESTGSCSRFRQGDTLYLKSSDGNWIAATVTGFEGSRYICVEYSKHRKQYHVRVEASSKRLRVRKFSDQ
eukprot:TRINITY_DN219_c0_g1_i2.p1 TRINITY_DN219_c0_g1~~TRINITY_DN219_c0_g1_i2.p1  ORF type:complete len:156 (+),score=13.37 TRINITY_DN219_c0_g1_i2:117-584(+)